MTIEDVLDEIGHRNMAVAVQAAGLAHVLQDDEARESAKWIHAEALATHRLIRRTLSDLTRNEVADAIADSNDEKHEHPLAASRSTHSLTPSR
ncbi:MAG: hypothetical protein WA964_08785 [Ilumatobacter sp.]|uniref:hypothetical protein n=1 Tax=Ilumatobacter sp. TaxID=1967498 RepID=UPI003C71A192